jgi:hypothetical protein
MYLDVDEFLENCLIEALALLESHLEKNFKVYIANTQKGAKAYYKTTGNPVLINNYEFYSTYGSVEEHKGIHFIFLHSDLVNTWSHGDIIATMIHELLHIIYPLRDEEEIQEIADLICKEEDVQKEDILDFLGEG